MTESHSLKSTQNTSKKEIVLPFHEIRKEFVENKTKPHVFLGNGFNMAIGVNTSYSKLKESLLKDYAVRNFLDKNQEDPGLRKKLEGNPDEMEVSINASPIKEENKNFIKRILYNEILNACKVKYKYKETIFFLELFDQYFTTNYDPLLYLFLLSGKEEKEAAEDRKYYEAVERIHKGSFQAPGRDPIPLGCMTKKQACEVIMKFLREEFEDKKSKHCYAVLKKIRDEDIIPLRDGFITAQSSNKKNPGYTRWLGDVRDVKELYAGNASPNLFYLHGAIHLYKHRLDDPQKCALTRKISKRGRSFINHLLQTGEDVICVFNQDSKKKLKSIDRSKYLKTCHQRFKAIKGDLCIVGWSCADSDQHLIDAINENKEIGRLFISFHGPSKEGIIRSYKNKFPSKSRIFFNVEEAFAEVQGSSCEPKE